MSTDSTHTAGWDADRVLSQTDYVRLLARQLVGNPAGAEELAQQTLIAAWQSGPDRPESVRGWLRRVARRLLLRNRRSQSRREQREQLALRPATAPSTAEIFEREATRREVIEAVVGLSEPYRTTFILRYLEELPPREVARQMGVPVETVRTRLKRGLELLRARLEPHHDGDRAAWIAALITLGGPTLVPSVLAMTTKLKVAAASAVAALVLALLFALDVFPGTSAAPPVAGGAKPEELVADGHADAETGPASSDERSPSAVESDAGAKPAATRGSLLVRVVEAESGQRVSGARIVARFDAGEGLRAVRRIQADAQGVARIEDLPPGSVWIVSAVNVMAGVNGTAVAGQSTEVELKLPKGVHLQGVVESSGGRPVKGAMVELAHVGLEGHGDPVATTDERGRFELRGVARVVYIGARAKGHAPSPFRSVSANPGSSKDVRIVLGGPGGGVTGTVFGPEGMPIAGALVRVGDPKIATTQQPDRSFARTACPVVVTTDTKGRFRADGFPIGELPILVRAPGLALWKGSVKVTAGVSTDMRVDLGLGVACEGTVTDGAGKPLAKIDVVTGPSGDLESFRTTTDASGAYRLAGLPVGEIGLRISDHELGKAEVKLRGRAGETLRWDPTVDRGVVLQGVVRTERGEPVAGAMVQVEALAGRPRWANIGQTDAAGRFAVPNCPAGRKLTILIGKRGFLPHRQNDIDPRTGKLEVRMRVAATPTVKVVGTVLDPEGRPVADAAVQVSGRNGGATRRTATGTGKFELGPIRPGSYQINVRIPGYAVYRTKSRTLGDGETWDVGAIRLEKGGQLRVKLTGQDAAAREKVALWIFDAELRTHDRVDGNGAQRTSALLASGPLFLAVSGPEVASQWLPFAIRSGATTDLEVVLQRGVPVKISCSGPQVDASQLVEGVQPVQLEIRRDGVVVQRRRRFQRGSAPAVLSCSLRPGVYEVRAKGVGGSARGELRVVAGAAAAAALELRLR